MIKKTIASILIVTSILFILMWLSSSFRVAAQRLILNDELVEVVDELNSKFKLLTLSNISAKRALLEPPFVYVYDFYNAHNLHLESRFVAFLNLPKGAVPLIISQSDEFNEATFSYCLKNIINKEKDIKLLYTSGVLFLYFDKTNFYGSISSSAQKFNEFIDFIDGQVALDNECFLPN